MDPEIKAEERDPKKIVRAMEMVTKVLMQGELQSVRQSIADLEARMSERFEDLKKELTEAVFVQIDSLQQLGPSQEDIDKVKEMQRRQRETNLRENSYWLGQLVAADRYGLDPRDILIYEQMVEALDVETVQAAAREYLRTDNYVQVSLYPESGAEPTQQE